MRWILLFSVVACSTPEPEALQSPSYVAVRTAPDNASWAPGRVLVRIADPGKALKAAGQELKLARSYKRIPFALFTFDPAVPVDKVVQDLRAQGIFAEPDYERHALVNDTYRTYQWGLDNIQADTAWATRTGSGVVVAVVDTGSSSGPLDGLNNLTSTGYDFVNSDSDPSDDEGHGTHVAGTIAAATDNSAGVAGVAYSADIMAVKVLDQFGSGYTSDVVAGIEHATLNGANVINMSLGSSFSSVTEEAAVDDAWTSGVFVVAASGNANASSLDYPAGYANCVSVGAVDYNNDRAWYSNKGSTLDLVAPGGDVAVDLNGDGYADGILQETFSGGSWGYFFFEGTSMATPHVAAAAAMLMEAGATNDEALTSLQNSALDLGTAGHDSSYGHGLIQLQDALDDYAGTQPVDSGDSGDTADTADTAESDPGPLCTLTVTRARYKNARSRLTIWAESDDYSYDVTAYADGALLGAVPYKNNKGRYQKSFTLSSAPAEIEIESTCGASATATVEIR